MTPFQLRRRLRGLLGGETADGSPSAASAHSAPAATPPSPAPAKPAAVPTPVASPAPARPVAAPVAPTPATTASASPSPASASPSPSAGASPATSPEDAAKEAERQRRHWERTRKGMLKWLADQGGSSPLDLMHNHSESRYFVGHRAFSRLMEEFTTEGLVDYASGTATLTEAGRGAL